MRKSTLLVLLLSGAVLAVAGEQPRGKLFIIGGGRRSDGMMEEFVRLAGGPAHARIIVLPMASGDPDTAGMEQVAEFSEMGARAEWIQFTREQASNPASSARLDSATGIYFTGGDQARVTRAVLGTPLYRKLHELHRRGVVIGGTSAGAAIMSKIMLTGDERLNKDSNNAYVFIKRDNVVTVEGLGFLGTVIVDQHFIRRKRLNRLLSVVLENPAMLGIGIDESTAIIVEPDSTFRVIGDRSVMIFDAGGAARIRTNAVGNMGVTGVQLHLLLPGDRFNLRTRSLMDEEKRP
jgi:cyanophycinase